MGRLHISLEYTYIRFDKYSVLTVDYLTLIVSPHPCQRINDLQPSLHPRKVELDVVKKVAKCSLQKRSSSIETLKGFFLPVLVGEHFIHKIEAVCSHGLS
ncbi:hypothetical protein Dimus_032256 [Dionaea muscipula]